MGRPKGRKNKTRKLDQYKDEIKKLPINSIDELFRFLTGVNVNARNDFGVQVDVGIRGSTFSQVLFLIDNIFNLFFKRSRFFSINIFSCPWLK